MEYGRRFSKLMSNLDLLKIWFSYPLGPSEDITYNFDFSPQLTSDEDDLISYVTLDVKDADNHCLHCYKCQHYNAGKCKGILESNGYKERTFTSPTH